LKYKAPVCRDHIQKSFRQPVRFSAVLKMRKTILKKEIKRYGNGLAGNKPAPFLRINSAGARQGYHQSIAK
jgi:hypothetical protein